MTISIDYDKTWSADPSLWRKFYYDAKDRGHRVIVATNRKEWSDDMKRGAIPDDCSIYFCGGEFKETALLKLGVSVNVWIDDMPGTVQHPLIIGCESADGL